jgi:hypothetical protein
MAIQFCKFQETLFRNIVVIDKYYYVPVKIKALFLLHPVYYFIFKWITKKIGNELIYFLLLQLE